MALDKHSEKNCTDCLVCVAVYVYLYTRVCLFVRTQRYPCVDINVILGKAVELAGLR